MCGSILNVTPGLPGFSEPHLNTNHFCHNTSLCHLPGSHLKLIAGRFLISRIGACITGMSSNCRFCQETQPRNMGDNSFTGHSESWPVGHRSSLCAFFQKPFWGTSFYRLCLGVLPGCDQLYLFMTHPASSVPITDTGFLSSLLFPTPLLS
jgi:hypothetical protein